MFSARHVVLAAACLLALTACSEPDRVDQASSEPGSPATEAADKPAGSLLETGFGQRDDYVSVIAMVENTADKVGQTVTVQFNVTDKAGELLGSESQVEHFSRLSQKMPVLTQVEVPAGKKAAKVDATLLVEDNGAFSSEPYPQIPVGKVSLKKAEYGSGWSAKVQVNNPKAKPLKSPRIDVVCRDAKQKIVGGGFTFPELVPPSGKALVGVDILAAGKPAGCTAFAGPPILDE